MSSIIDAIIVGSGLAGLTVALHILDRGGRVVVVEKEPKFGGNSMKASSGINAVPLNNDDDDDSIDTFKQDTIKSAGKLARTDLIDILVNNSNDAITWLKERVGAELDDVGQLGGHKTARTYRPKEMPVGAELMSKLQKQVKQFEEGDNGNKKATIQCNAKVTKLLTNENGIITGIEYEDIETKECKQLLSNNVILATGGYAADRTSGSYIAKYRPELINFPATAGPFSTGDGISLASVLHSSTRDMEQIQIHPTGFIDPKDPNNLNKFLAAEILRGVGGILLNPNGKRFCNELGRRDYITDKILELNPEYSKTKKWDASYGLPNVFLLLSEEAANKTKKHIEFYAWKGFLVKVQGIKSLAEHTGLAEDVLTTTIKKYIDNASNDEFGKETIISPPGIDDDSVYYVGKVTPVLHYCMGGLATDGYGRVLMNDDNNNKQKQPIPGLYACGEVSGGVHGENRLGGNSLLECVVFGTIIGKNIEIQSAS